MSTDQAFRASVLELVSQLAEDGSAGIEPQSRLSDIGFDSLAFAELAATIEERFGIDLVDGSPACPRTVGEVVELIETARASAKPSGALLRGEIVPPTAADGRCKRCLCWRIGRSSM